MENKPWVRLADVEVMEKGLERWIEEAGLNTDTRAQKAYRKRFWVPAVFVYNEEEGWVITEASKNRTDNITWHNLHSGFGAARSEYHALVELYGYRPWNNRMDSGTVIDKKTIRRLRGD